MLCSPNKGGRFTEVPMVDEGFTPDHASGHTTAPPIGGCPEIVVGSSIQLLSHPKIRGGEQGLSAANYNYHPLLTTLFISHHARTIVSQVGRSTWRRRPLRWLKLILRFPSTSL